MPDVLMLVFPNIKLNLGLEVLRRRPDGYHDLQTCFLPIPGCGDALEIVPCPAKKGRLHLSGIPIAGVTEDNLVWGAYQLLRSCYPVPELDLYLYKKVPTGSGVGAGSSDAAFAMKVIAEVAGLDLAISVLEELALELGSDCPVFIQNRPTIAQGRGEQLEPIQLSLQGWGVRVVFTGVHVSTREAFAGLEPRERDLGRLKDTLAMEPHYWPQHLENDFEQSVFALHPELAAIKRSLYEQGADYAAMSGSGSAVFGLFAPGRWQALGWQKGYWEGGL